MLTVARGGSLLFIQKNIYINPEYVLVVSKNSFDLNINNIISKQLRRSVRK